MKYLPIQIDKWFLGSTRWELEPDERSVWHDLLVRAAQNEPVGQINYFSFEQLAEYFRVPIELFNRTIEKCKQNYGEHDIPKITIDEEHKIIYLNKWNAYNPHYTKNKTEESQKPPEPKSESTYSNEEYFNKIWARYPDKVGKKEAYRHYIASVKTEQDLNDIQQALANYLASKRVNKGFIQNGSTWFNNWRDWVNYKEKGSWWDEHVKEALNKGGEDAIKE